MIILITYFAYLLISIALTIWVAETLFRNGRIFLVEVFSGNAALADSVNRLLVVGFYLLNFGYVALALKIEGEIGSYRVGLEALAGKLGVVMLILGGMHFLNLIIFSTVRSSHLADKKRAGWQAPPQAPLA